MGTGRMNGWPGKAESDVPDADVIPSPLHISALIYCGGKKIRLSREGGKPASFSAKSLGPRPRLTAFRGRLRGDDECLIFSHLILKLMIEKRNYRTPASTEYCLGQLQSVGAGKN